jgi:hypothetical protein
MGFLADDLAGEPQACRLNHREQVDAALQMSLAGGADSPLAGLGTLRPCSWLALPRRRHVVGCGRFAYIGRMTALAAVSRLTRVTQIALWVNAILHAVGSIAMALGLGPQGAAEPITSRRMAAGAIAAIVMFGFVSKRLPKDPALIALPWTFVLCNFADTIYEFIARRDVHDLAPAIPEASFFALYSIFALTSRSARTST